MIIMCLEKLGTSHWTVKLRGQITQKVWIYGLGRVHVTETTTKQEENMAIEKKSAKDDKSVDTKVDIQKDEKKEDVKVAETAVKIKNISIKLPEDIHRKLKAKCAMEGESAGNVMKRLIDDYIKE